MRIRIPYGSSFLPLDAPEGAELLLSGLHRLQPAAAPGELVRRAMETPVASPKLESLAAGKRSAVILCSDHTRPVPSRLLLPPLLRALRRGNPKLEIQLLVATGCHRPSTREELAQKFGEDILAQERLVQHDCADEARLVTLGTLPSGAPLRINALAAGCDLLLAEGFIEPHFFAGFSGGRKSVLPGVCARETVLGNHCAAFIASPKARAGCLEGNPIHEDMEAAARMAKLAYILNVVLDGEKRVAAAFAGEPIQAHRAGCNFLLPYCRVQPKRAADIVVSSNGGAPLDQNIYQAVKGLSAAAAAAAPGAVLVLCASCADGHGGEHFFTALRDCASPEALYRRILAVPQGQTRPDQWQVQILVKILREHRVIFVSEPAAAPLLAQMKLEYAPTLEEAMARAYAQKGSGARLCVIPDGVAVAVEPPQEPAREE